MATTKAQQALELFRQESSRAQTGTDLHNAFFGIGGTFGRLFPSRQERDAFFKTPQYREIARIQDELDRKSKPQAARR